MAKTTYTDLTLYKRLLREARPYWPHIVGIFLLDWQLALVALAVSPVLFFLTQFYRGRLRPKWREIKKLDSTAYSILQEVLTSLRVVKAF